MKQGCVLVPTLFSLKYSAMLSDAFCDMDVGTGIRYCTDGSPFNLRLQAKTKVSTDTINELLFADDFASEGEMQHAVDLFANVCHSFRLNISIKKTKVTHQTVPGKPCQVPNITVNRSS